MAQYITGYFPFPADRIKKTNGEYKEVESRKCQKGETNNRTNGREIWSLQKEPYHVSKGAREAIV